MDGASLCPGLHPKDKGQSIPMSLDLSTFNLLLRSKASDDLVPLVEAQPG